MLEDNEAPSVAPRVPLLVRFGTRLTQSTSGPAERPLICESRTRIMFYKLLAGRQYIVDPDVSN
jgi:hypothetical protein